MHRDDALEAWDMARTRPPGEIRPSTTIRRHLAAFDAEGEIGPRRAIAALAKLGRPALDVLLQIAKDEPRVRVRRWAQEALTPFTDRRVFPVLAASLADPHMSVRLHALLALAARREPRAAKAIIPLLRDPSGGVRVNAVAALAHV
ncbi:MAG: HEAT repeat domain-containing protein, partial [Planctomycetes bacterium]|nr:HEAT repeat domain-containing protein [Planctomycetota bacterium]